MEDFFQSFFAEKKNDKDITLRIIFPKKLNPDES